MRLFVYLSCQFQVQHIVKQILKAKQTVNSVNTTPTKQRKSGLSALFDVSSWFEDNTRVYGDMSSAEIKKLNFYLDASTKHLCNAFEVSLKSVKL